MGPLEAWNDRCREACGDQEFSAAIRTDLVPEWGELQVTAVRNIQSHRLWLLAIIVVPGLGQQPTLATNRDKEPIATTLCEVVAHPENFANKRVTFRASFESDGLDHSILNHSGCKLGIVPYPAKDDKKRPDVEAFDKAIEEGAPGTADKTVVAIFTGRFVWKPSSKGILEIEGVSELHVSPRKSGPGKPKK